MEIPFDSSYDYSSKGFLMPLTIEGMNMYACINTELHYNEGLAETGSYIIYLLHPKNGSCVFKIEQNADGRWGSPDAPVFIPKELVQEIGVEIVEREI